MIVGVLGTSHSMNPIDATGYMSIPAFVALCIPGVYMQHPVASQEWPDRLLPKKATDTGILATIWELDPKRFSLIVLFAPACFLYNLLQWTVVQKLSSNYTAFAGNFNKATSIAISLIFGLDPFPTGYWGMLNVAAVMGNILAFTAHGFLQQRAKKDQRSSDMVSHPQKSVTEAS